MNTTELSDRKIILDVLVAGNAFLAAKASHISASLEEENDVLFKLLELHRQGYDVLADLEACIARKDRLCDDLDNLQYHKKTIEGIEELHRDEIFPPL